MLLGRPDATTYHFYTAVLEKSNLNVDLSMNS